MADAIDDEANDSPSDAEFYRVLHKIVDACEGEETTLVLTILAPYVARVFTWHGIEDEAGARRAADMMAANILRHWREFRAQDAAVESIPEVHGHA